MINFQKTIKYCAIVFAIMLIIFIFGTIFQAVYGINYLFSDNDIVTDDFSKNNYSDDIDFLDIKIGASKVEIKEGKKFSIETNNKYISSKQQGSKLLIEDKRNRYKINNKSRVIIYIPKNAKFDDVELEIGAGSLDLSYLHTDFLDLQIGAGEININKLIVDKKASIEGGAGEINIDNAVINNLDLEAGVGEVNVTGRFTKEALIEAGVGEVNININDKEDNYRMRVKKGIGSITINNKSKSNGTYGDGLVYIDVNGGIGSVNIKFKES